MVGANVTAAAESERQVHSEELVRNRRALRGYKGKARRFCTNLSDRTCLLLSAAASTLTPASRISSFKTQNLKIYSTHVQGLSELLRTIFTIYLENF